VSDDLSKRETHDSSRINVSQKWKVRYWTEKLKVTEDKLREAVRKVGNSARAVRDHLTKRH
jgi:hypothetical protein